MRWWRVFIDTITGKRKKPGVVGPRRRQAPRYPYAAKVRAQCSSWPKLVELFTGDVSQGGLYIPTDQAAAVGETVQIELELPNGRTIQVSGAVVNIIDAEYAARIGKRPGLGVQLDELEGEALAQFEQIVRDAAKQASPLPEDTMDGSPRPRRPSPVPSLAETSDVLRLSSIQEAIADDADESEPVDLSEDDDAPAAAAPLPAPRHQAMPPPVPGAKPPVLFKETPEPPAAPPPRKLPPPSVGPSRGGDDPIVGIDLGTTYSSVGAVVGKKVLVLPFPDGARSAASVLTFPEPHRCIVGSEARKCLATDPPHTVASPKRLLGRKFTDREIQAFIGQAPYRTFAGPDGSVVVEIWQQQYAVTQLCAYIVEEARKAAEASLGRQVQRCVMTVPVSFDDERAKIYRRAAEMARLEVIAMIDEPSAAALANRFDPNFGGIVGVYDFGGGTFDFSVVDVTKGDFQVLATAGDTWLGGDDFDAVLAEAAANQFWRMHKVDLRRQAVEWQKLVFACERAKRALSVDNEAVIFVPEVLRTAQGMIDLNISLDRTTFERACKPVIDRSLATCDEALDLLGMKRGDLTTIYLSGGTTYIPVVREGLARHFGVPVRTGVPPEHAVCLGAAIHAAQIQFSAATTLDAR